MSAIINYGDEFVEPTYYYRWDNGRGFMLDDKKRAEYDTYGHVFGGGNGGPAGDDLPAGRQVCLT